MEINFKYNPDVILSEIRERVRLWEFDKVKEDEFLANWKNLLDNATDVEINNFLKCVESKYSIWCDHWNAADDGFFWEDEVFITLYYRLVYEIFNADPNIEFDPEEYNNGQCPILLMEITYVILAASICDRDFSLGISSENSIVWSVI